MYEPTIKQIIEQADRIGDRPMSKDEAETWYEFTVEENRERKSTEADNAK